MRRPHARVGHPLFVNLQTARRGCRSEPNLVPHARVGQAQKKDAPQHAPREANERTAGASSARQAAELVAQAAIERGAGELRDDAGVVDESRVDARARGDLAHRPPID